MHDNCCSIMHVLEDYKRWLHGLKILMLHKRDMALVQSQTLIVLSREALAKVLVSFGLKRTCIW